MPEQFYEAHFRLYKTQAEESESWAAAHDEAMACCDLEDAIGLGLTVLENLRRRSARCGEAQGPLWNTASELARVYSSWLDVSRHLLDGAVRRLEGRGFKVERADELRQACRDVALLPLDTDRIRRSLDSLASGKGIPMKQALDGLRNRLRRVAPSTL
jgi:hypothetical protein